MSLPLGVILALGRQSNMFLIKTFSVIFIEFIRGVPLITLLFVASRLAISAEAAAAAYRGQAPHLREAAGLDRGL